MQHFNRELLRLFELLKHDIWHIIDMISIIDHMISIIDLIINPLTWYLSEIIGPNILYHTIIGLNFINILRSWGDFMSMHV